MASKIMTRGAQAPFRYVLSCVGATFSCEALARLSTLLAEVPAQIDHISPPAWGRLRGVEITFSSDTLLDARLLSRQIAADVEACGVDVAIQPAALYRTPKNLLCLDMDSTLVQIEGIDALAKEAGVFKRVAGITHRAMNGEMSFPEALRERVALLAGLSAGALARVHKQAHLTPGARMLIRTLQSRGCKVAVLSGGFDYFASRIQKTLGLDYAYANHLEIQNGRLTGKIVGEVVDGARKRALLEMIAKKERVRANQVIAIGDGANDLPMLHAAGLGIAYHAKPNVRAQAPYNLTQNTLEAVLCWMGGTRQGYGKV